MMLNTTTPPNKTFSDLMLSPTQQLEYAKEIPALLSWTLTPRQVCDLELLLNGGFSPLTGFMGRTDYESVVERMRLSSNHVWPMPITLDVHANFATSLAKNSFLALRDQEGLALALLKISDIWQPNKEHEAKKVFNTLDKKHPGVAYLLDQTGSHYIGGELLGLQPPSHYDFKHLRHAPSELHEQFKKLGWGKVVAFQTRNPMHRAHFELTFEAAKSVEANLLINPVVGMTKPGDIDHFTRVRCYEKLTTYYPAQTTLLSLLPLAMRMGGPREALWHAIIRRNLGCTHFIVGRDHAGPGADSEGKPFYDPYAAQELVGEYQTEVGIEMLPFQEVVYVANKAQYLPLNKVSPDDTPLTVSGTELRHRLQNGLDIPEWFSYPEIIEELRHTHPQKHQQGFTLFFTGLSGAGKSTIANALLLRLMEIGRHSVTLLDGDIVRQHLSSELGFSKEHRDLNISRIGFVAAEITKHRGIAICAPIAPYRQVRNNVRKMVSAVGGFIEIHVATPIEVCEERDRKGLYAKARAGLLPGFTGIDDPYEVPEHPELIIDASKVSVMEAVQQILLKIEHLGFLTFKNGVY